MPVRPLRPADLPHALALNQAEVPAVGDLDADRLAHLVDQATLALVATLDGDDTDDADDADDADDVPIGFCIVLDPYADYGSVNYRWFRDRYDDFVYLDRVAVAPTARGRGVGRALYDEVERRVEAAWFTLEVNLRPRNDASLAFHAALGFHEVGQQETPYGTLVSLMAKPLR